MKLLRHNQAWYQWYYHAQLDLLLVMPGDLMSDFPVLWPKILSACGLPPWPSFLREDHAKFIPSQEGLNLLLRHFRPAVAWLLSYPKQACPLEMTTPIIETSAKLANGHTKKEIWLKWMAQKQIQAIAS